MTISLPEVNFSLSGRGEGAGLLVPVSEQGVCPETKVEIT